MKKNNQKQRRKMTHPCACSCGCQIPVSVVSQSSRCHKCNVLNVHAE